MQRPSIKFPDNPGVYIFRGQQRAILYIGKATSLRSRVASYFRRDLIATRGPIIVGMVETAKSVDFIETDSVLEALILEAHLIKKHQPPYNTKEKDNKSFNYVVITKEDFPRVLVVRGRELEAILSTKNSVYGRATNQLIRLQTTFGPFPQGSVLREALSIVRKIFPFRDKCLPAYLFDQRLGIKNKLLQKRLAGKQGKPCFNAQIWLCPGVCTGTMTRAEYAKTIRRIKLFFEGKKKTLINGLEREMKTAAKNQKFEEAGRIKRMIFALNHIQDVALLKYVPAPSSNVRGAVPACHRLTASLLSDEAVAGRSVVSCSSFSRIEAYDVAHISGTNVVGVMVVVEDNEPKKSEYRKFKIKTSTNDDNASLREILERRFNHSEWPMPKLIVVDGGRAQVNTAEKALKEWGIGVPVVGVVKDEHHKPKDFLGDKEIIKDRDRAILLANSEAHRFAIGFHRQLRGKLK